MRSKIKINYVPSSSGYANSWRLEGRTPMVNVAFTVDYVGESQYSFLEISGQPPRGYFKFKTFVFAKNLIKALDNGEVRFSLPELIDLRNGLQQIYDEGDSDVKDEVEQFLIAVRDYIEEHYSEHSYYQAHRG